MLAFLNGHPWLYQPCKTGCLPGRRCWCTRRCEWKGRRWRGRTRWNWKCFWVVGRECGLVRVWQEFTATFSLWQSGFVPDLPAPQAPHLRQKHSKRNGICISVLRIVKGRRRRLVSCGRRKRTPCNLVQGNILVTDLTSLSTNCQVSCAQQPHTHTEIRRKLPGNACIWCGMRG